MHNIRYKKTMSSFRFLVLILSVYLSNGQQFYDATLCSSNATHPGTRYTCINSGSSCQTFFVYRVDEQFQTISSIYGLFNKTPDDNLLRMNNVSSSSQILSLGREVLVPITCFCIGQFFQANFHYIVQGNSMTFIDIACGVFESLTKSSTLLQENNPDGITLFLNDMVAAGSTLKVPLKCACPDNSSASAGMSYLVTYPLIPNDNFDRLSRKFKVAAEDIWQANNLGFEPTVYPNTTILVPLKTNPSLNFSIPDSDPPSPGFLPTEPVQKASKTAQLKRLYITVAVVGFSLVLVTLVGCVLYIRALKKFKVENIHPSARRSSANWGSTPRSSPLSGPTRRNSTCLSPDLLTGIQYSLCSYSTEELKQATKDFNEDTRMGHNIHRGLIDNAEVIIRELKFEDTKQVIDVHSKINHIHIMKLSGVCYGENDISWLVFEFPSNGCLRSCLSSSSSSFRWHKRTQIAFDIATALHYLHYCMVPPYVHMSISSRNIFLTQNWRAKLAVFRAIPSSWSWKEHESTGSVQELLAPEHRLHGLVSEKIDIFAFGVVLLELMSGKQDMDGKLSGESISFLGGGGCEGGCFEQLRNFMDPSLKEDYPLAEALCLAVLAKACIEDEPLHRPTIDDIIKVLARMV